MKSPKNLIFAANWKLHKNPKETREFLTQLLVRLPDFQRHQVMIFPQALSLETTAHVLHDTEIRWGAQNCYSQTSGAFTGEISAQGVRDLGGQLVLLGHSERRTLFHETDLQIKEKVKLVQSLGMCPVLCVGENLEQRESGQTQKVLSQQLEAVLSYLFPQDPLMIAYEPVWAIGTGHVASSEQVQQTHSWIRELIVKLNPEKGSQIPLLYGGSVKPENARTLAYLPDVQGFLIGGASLELESFLKICSVSEKETL